MVDQAMTRHVLPEQRLMSNLNDDEQAQLTSLLRKLLVALDRP